MIIVLNINYNGAASVMRLLACLHQPNKTDSPI